MQSMIELTRRGFLGRSAAIGAGLPILSSLASAAESNAAAKPAERPARAGRGRQLYQIGCYTRPWGAHEYTVAFDAIAEAGFKYVGLMTTKRGLIISSATSVDEARRVGEEAKKRKLQIVSVYGGDIPVDQSLQAGIDALRKLIDNCAAAGSAALLMGGVGDPKLYKDYYKAIAECCDYAAGKKLSITVKPHGGSNSTGPECRKAVESVGHRNFTLWYDPGNIFYYSEGKLNPADDAGTVDGVVTGMCVKDFLPAKGKDPKSVDVTPGTGAVDFAKVLGRLRKGGLTDGPLVVETLAAKPDLAGTLVEAKKAREFLENLVRSQRTTRPAR
jgi:sugar phosphate isomerase/epimerase